MQAKSILFVIFLSIMSVSCSTDEDSDTPKDDIIGTWGIFEYLEEDGRVREVDPRLSGNQITFHLDSTVSSGNFDEIGNWQNVGNGTYEVTSEGETYEGETAERVEVLELLNNGVLKSEYGNGEATFLKKMKE